MPSTQLSPPLRAVEGPGCSRTTQCMCPSRPRTPTASAAPLPEPEGDMEATGASTSDAELCGAHGSEGVNTRHLQFPCLRNVPTGPGVPVLLRGSEGSTGRFPSEVPGAQAQPGNPPHGPTQPMRWAPDQRHQQSRGCGCGRLASLPYVRKQTRTSNRTDRSGADGEPVEPQAGLSPSYMDPNGSRVNFRPRVASYECPGWGRTEM